MKTLPLAIAAFAVATTAAFAAAPVKTVKTDKGEVLAGENGMTLYVYKDDTKGMSNCYEKCAVNWPPLKAEANAAAEGVYTVIDRKDGTKQWAKDGMPLYYWIKDKKEGDATGDGVGGKWNAARP
ncbi:putative lipoprotein with Yx(FWY)xxD motif [Mycoplana sp. BE70]|uniref:COG4315 family predicted lipoprotein n=1 Tax=Mycoplana sp. BE70 TaxID=2817775 RepID=UPI0028594D8A|nr:hypothetical protein [Mycoplana sp. BE70]MDR6756573.1 putative lipoprotein with Yx(FWY)xxD motif [Mycoplana sp. BE70]